VIFMEFSYKFRIYPNKAQENLIQKTFGCSRFIYNYYLAKRKEVYEQSGKTMGRFECNKDLTGLKKQEEYQWLREVDSTALLNAIASLDTAFQNFFRRVKKGEKPGYPRFKSKKNHRKSYKSSNNGTNIKVLDNALQLPKLGRVKCKIHRPVQGRVLSVTISQNRSGKYYAAINCTEVEIPELPKTGGVIGLNMGIRNFAISSDGVNYENPKYLSKSEKKLKRYQRQLSRKTKDSKNWEKTRIKLARLSEHVANQRKDTLHKLSADMVKQNDVICIKDLDIKDMMQEHHFAKHIVDTGWGEFRRQLTYKAKWYGKDVVVVDRLYPSSQICSSCGTQRVKPEKNQTVKWQCQNCGKIHDRYHNAAVNIMNEGLRCMA